MFTNGISLFIGLVSNVYAPDQLVDEAVKMGQKIAGFSQPIGKNMTREIDFKICFRSIQY